MRSIKLNKPNIHFIIFAFFPYWHIGIFPILGKLSNDVRSVLDKNRTTSRS